jgi:hypothetical protein
MSAWRRPAPNAFREFLRGLPDAIERARERGQPIVLPDPGTEHGRRLYATLGVEISSEPLDDARRARDRR